MEALRIVLAAAPLLLQFALAARMWRTRMHRQYRLFFCFLIFDVGSSAVTIPLWRMGQPAYAAFFYSYWTAEAVRALLGFAVLWEIYHAALRNYEGLQRLAGVAFRGALAVLLLVAIVLAASNPAAGPNPMVAAIMVLERSVHLVQAGLLLALLLFKAQLGLAWRHPLFGIAVGFAVYATLQVVIFAVRAAAGPVADPMLRLLAPLSYNLAVFTWLAYLWQADRAPVALTPRLNADLLRWDRALAEVLQR